MTNLMKVVYDKFKSEDAIRFPSLIQLTLKMIRLPVLKSYGQENKIDPR